VKVLIFSAYFPPAFLGGGALKSVSAIVSQAPARYETAILTSDRDLGQSKPLDVDRNVLTPWRNSKVFYASTNRFKYLIRAFACGRDFRPEIVYTNSFFDPLFSVAPLIMWKLGMFGSSHFVIASRGEFGPGALSIRKFKKRLFILVFRCLSGRNIVFHASSPEEAKHIRAQVGAGAGAAIIVREDNIDLPVAATTPVVGSERLQVVYLGRIVPVKGLDTLLLSLGSVSLPITLDIYGPEEDRKYADRCRQIASDVPENVSVNFRGPLNASEVTEVLQGYDVMSMPTRGENFSHVIAEALSVSLPVMCADVTPWSDHLRNGGGVLLPSNGVTAWSEGITEYARQSVGQRLSRRIAAGARYEHWRGSSEPHIFDLLVADAY
jgi:glycosyltransferase involved in cell wall biosynthesis